MKRKKKNDSVEKWSHKHDYPITDIWNTNHVLAGIIVSRLWAFKDHEKHGLAPGCADMDEWNKIIQKMIDAFALLKHTYSHTDEENRVIEEGLDLFRKYFRYLWD